MCIVLKGEDDYADLRIKDDDTTLSDMAVSLILSLPC